MKVLKGEEEIFTVLEAQGSCFHCAGCEGCGYQTGRGQRPPVVQSSRTQEDQHWEQTNDHLDRKVKYIKMMKDDAECKNNKLVKCDIYSDKKAVLQLLNQGDQYLQ